jgi:hypothetical protein
MTVDAATTDGKKGNEVSVCGTLFPMPFGSWQGDYMVIGLPVVAPYVASDGLVRCSKECIDVVTREGLRISETRIWNDQWVPPHPKDGATRCGVSTMMDEAVLTSAQDILRRRLAWFARLQIWRREKENGDYSKSERTAFVLD